MFMKMQASIESLILLITWGTAMSIVTGFVGFVYYMSILKLNVVDVKYNGSWKLYVQSIFKYFRK